MVRAKQYIKAVSYQDIPLRQSKPTGIESKANQDLMGYIHIIIYTYQIQVIHRIYNTDISFNNEKKRQRSKFFT